MYSLFEFEPLPKPAIFVLNRERILFAEQESRIMSPIFGPSCTRIGLLVPLNYSP